MQPGKKLPRYLILGLAILTGLMLRVDGLKWGIPKAPYWKAYHPDERVAFSLLLKMTTSDGSLNPHYFVNPTFHYYLIGSAWWIVNKFHLVPSFKEAFGLVESNTVTLEDVTRVWLTARTISVILGILTIWLTYMLGLEFFEKEIYALGAAWLTAVMPTLVVQSHYLTVDGPVGFWFLAALLLMIRAFKQDRLWFWVAAGLVSGLSVATKYNALPGIVAAFTLLCIWAILKSKGKIGKIHTKASIFAGCLAVGFLLGCPYALISFGEWQSGIKGLLYYNDFATDWLYPWLQISRLSLGWPAWVMFLLSWAAVVFKPDKQGAFLASVIMIYFLIYGYKASPYMRHMVLIIPLMVLLIMYAVEKSLRYSNHPVTKALLISTLMLSSGHALANSLAWTRIMAGKDTREEAAEYIKQQSPLGSDIGLTGKYWFYTPPLDETEYNLIRLEYEPAKLEYFHPPLIIMSEYEAKQYAFCRVGPEVRDEFFRKLKGHYTVKKTFQRVPRCCGIKFEGYPLADWNYFYPEITIYERSFQ